MFVLPILESESIRMIHKCLQCDSQPFLQVLEKKECVTARWRASKSGSALTSTNPTRWTVKTTKKKEEKEVSKNILLTLQLGTSWPNKLQNLEPTAPGLCSRILNQGLSKSPALSFGSVHPYSPARYVLLAAATKSHRHKISKVDHPRLAILAGSIMLN